MYNYLLVFFSYFSVIMVSLTIASIFFIKKYDNKTLKANLLLSSIAVFALLIFMHFSDFSRGVQLLFVLIGLDMIEYNIFFPIIRGKESGMVQSNAILIALIVANLIEFGILYLFLI